ncbi:AAA family ATPase [Roseobacteraceae bacterium NS-SX3]
MRICAVRLENIRRFIAPVEIAGIGPGLNVLSAPNEQGKSTVFDALHALFFKDAKSWDKEIRALAPHAGGDPRIEVEIEHEGARCRIAKQFFKTSGKGEVKIWREGALLHQADAAEAWLKSLMAAPKDGGPAGLLWVRQGLTAFEDARETEDARRSLMASVAGEVGAVTGGQRMDRLRAEVRAELDRLVTKRGARAGGPLALAEAEAAELEAQRATLAGQVQDLHGLLEQRRSLRAEQAGLTDPGAVQEREARLRAAETALAAAERHQAQLDQARRQHGMAAAVLENHQRKAGALAARLKEYADLQAAEAQAAAAASEAEAALTGALARLKSAQDSVRSARTAAGEARKRRDRAVAAEAAQQAGARRRELTGRLEQARGLAARIGAEQARAAAGPDKRMMQAVEQAREALAMAEHARAASAAALVVTYEPGQEGALRLDGAPVAGCTRLPLPDGGRLELPGVAVIDIHPGEAAGADAVAKARAALSDALAAAGCGTVGEARTAHQARQEAAARLQEAQSALALLAPQGLDALEQELAAIPAPQEDAADLPCAAAAAAELGEALQAQEDAEQALEKARQAEAAARLAAQKCAVERDGSADRLAQLLAGLGGDGARAEAELAELAAQTPALAQAEQQAAAVLAALADAAPDADQARAAWQRAKSACDGARDRAQEIRTDLAVLETRIAAHASHAVEEELAETGERLAAAQKRLAAVRFEVAVLQRLDLALERARAAAQDHYVGPVLKELEPLLRMLWPDAQLQLDAEAVLPSRLERGAAEDSFDGLSGGTQEQIALLVRLAFARLLAKSGRPAPVILDDAIVYTDDARIEKIFDALTLLAGDLQIIVFSCRQKAFRDLGGTQLAIRPAADG